MLFRKDITKCCAYCLFFETKKSRKYVCSKKGTVSEDQACNQFQYDPCKRVPKKTKALDFKQFSEEDFSL